MKGTAQRLMLAVASVILTLAACELILRSVGTTKQATDRRGLHQPRPDRAWLYGMRPGAEGNFEVSGDVAYHINADGFRDHAYQRRKPEGVFRIIVLGDSVAFGYGVEMTDTFSKQMELQLRATSRDNMGPDIEVLNLGISGYNPYTEAALLSDVGGRYQPDLVIVQFCINDLNDPTLHFDVQTRLHLGAIPDAAYPDPSQRRAAPEPPGPWLRLCSHSRICSRLDRLWLASTSVEPTQEQREAAAVPHGSGIGKEWSWLAGIYSEMAETSKRLGAGFAVLAFPFPGQLEGRREHPVQQSLLELGRRGGWLTIDPLAAFRDERSETENLFIDWWHPTAAGHDIAARESLRALACGGLLPPEMIELCAPRN